MQGESHLWIRPILLEKRASWNPFDRVNDDSSAIS